MEDSACCGVYLGSTEFATVAFPARDSEVFGNTLTSGASDTFGPSSFFEEVKAGVVVGEVLAKRFNRVLIHDLMVS